MTYESRDAAIAAENDARRLLNGNARLGLTVGQWWTDWTTDPLWARPADSTTFHNRERTQRFAPKYWNEPLRAIGDEHVAEWLRGGANRGTAAKLRLMFNDAASAPAGRLVDRNPFANLRLPASRGRKDVQPPSESEIETFIATADELTPPSFAVYLYVAVHSGIRPGELGALSWEQIDFQAETILVDRQWCARVRKFTLPKHGVIRTIAHDPGTGSAPRSSARVRVRSRRCAARTTRRRLGRATGTGSVQRRNGQRRPLHRDPPLLRWYAFNVLGLADHVIAEQFGQRDGGKLLRTTYGHPDARIARERVRDAYRNRPTPPVPLRAAVGS